MPSVVLQPPASRRVTPSRLALARMLRGLSQTALAREVKVSQPAINQFESGDAQPSPETLERLAMALKVAPAFLSQPAVRDAGRPFFRSLARVPAGERDRAHAYTLALADVVAEFERHLELPALLVASVIAADENTCMDVIEGAAAQARRDWDIPTGPIANLIALAEARGVVVAAVGDFHPGIDAFTTPTATRPVMVLCSGKGVATRRRFDVAHELGHLALHDQRAEENRWQEQQAHRFASALLMPAEEIRPHLPTRGDDLRRLETVAKDWGVSMQAALMRARDLGCITIETHARGMRRLSAAGWRTREPVEIGPPERPQLLEVAVAALPDAGTSLEAVAEKLGLPMGRLQRMLSLPEAHDAERGGDVVNLPGRSAA
jgi:Zn-dependent peptidase ImmA (M78 family)/transcriptional regulator with XRE-family HTH domain